MAGTVLIGLALNTMFGWWWIEYVAALLFLVWLARETREAFEEAKGGRNEEQGIHYHLKACFISQPLLSKIPNLGNIAQMHL